MDYLFIYLLLKKKDEIFLREILFFQGGLRPIWVVFLSWAQQRMKNK